MADHITSMTERGLTTLVNDIDHIDSQSLNGVAVVKVFFRPSANIQTALAQVTAISQTIIRQLPAGTTPPLVIQYSASSVPILQVGLSSKTLPEQQLNDVALNFLRTQLITVQGAAIPYPFGGKSRLVSVDIDTPALQAKHLSSVDVVNAISAQNLILPSGTAKLGELEYQVELNSSPNTVAEINDLPIKTVNGTTIYIRDVAHVRDGFSPQTNVVRQDGTRGTLLSIMKNGGASTIDIVKNIQEMLPQRGADPAAGPEHQAAVRSVIVRARCHSRRGQRGADRRLPYRGDDFAVSGQLAQHADYRHLDSAFHLDLRDCAERAGTDLQHHDAGRVWRWQSASWSMTPPSKSKILSATWG